MGSERIFSAIVSNVIKVLPEVTPAMVKEQAVFEELGANSLDRVDIMVGVLDDLGLKVALPELGSPKSVASLISALQRHARHVTV